LKNFFSCFTKLFSMRFSPGGSILNAHWQLSSLCSLHIQFGENISYQTIPKLRELVRQLLKSVSIQLPSVIPALGTNVYTRKKLEKERKSL